MWLQHRLDNHWDPLSEDAGGACKADMEDFPSFKSVPRCSSAPGPPHHPPHPISSTALYIGVGRCQLGSVWASACLYWLTLPWSPVLGHIPHLLFPQNHSPFRTQVSKESDSFLWQPSLHVLEGREEVAHQGLWPTMALGSSWGLQYQWTLSLSTKFTQLPLGV